MKIRFIKDHTSGLKEGNIKDVASSFAARMIEAGYAVEHTEEPADITPPSTEEVITTEVLPTATEPEQPAAEVIQEPVTETPVVVPETTEKEETEPVVPEVAPAPEVPTDPATTETVTETPATEPEQPAAAKGKSKGKNKGK